MGAVAGVRAKLWFPAPRAERGREEGGFGCSPRPGLTSALEAAAQSGQALFKKKKKKHTAWKPEALRTELVGTV